MALKRWAGGMVAARDLIGPDGGHQVACGISDAEMMVR